jgi:precorrin-6Y C5,15-methyltransferase (decarboxylating)
MTAVSVVGIGADGWEGLSPATRALVGSAEVLLGAERHLDYLPSDLPGERRFWPSPLTPNLPDLFAGLAGRRVCVVASGDPMHYGIGATLVRLLGPDAVTVIPQPSSMSLACARLGWPVEGTRILSAVGRPVARLVGWLTPGQRLLLLSPGAETPAAVAATLVAAGYGASALTVLEQLGGPGERRTEHRAADLAGAPAMTPFDPLNIVAICAVPDPGTRPLGRTPGLPDDAFEHDGQITKREIRAVSLARLAPRPGELLWDIGGGSGSVSIEWMRAARGARAIAVERRADRAARIATNALALGVPDLQVVQGAAPAALAGLPAPDAVFVGGGGSNPAVLEVCWAALSPGGRLVANAVTLQTEAALVARCAQLGGDLVRLEISHAVPLGRFTGWHAAHPVTQWTVTK